MDAEGWRGLNHKPKDGERVEVQLFDGTEQVAVYRKGIGFFRHIENGGMTKVNPYPWRWRRVLQHVHNMMMDPAARQRLHPNEFDKMLRRENFESLKKPLNDGSPIRIVTAGVTLYEGKPDAEQDTH